MVQRRQRRAAGSSDAAIGASEFATALNNSGGGDNSAVVLNALRRFAKTVRRQRRLALSSSEHVVPADGPDELASEEDLIATDSDSELEEEEETDIDEIDDDDELVPMKGGNGTAPPKPSRIPNTQPAKKRYKRDEAWKEDSASYNVPFVGTAAFVQRDRVVRGEWPTGLLQAYLAKSPLAVELTATTMGETKKDLDAHAAAVGSDKKKKGNAALKDDNTITKNNKQKMLSQAIQKAHLVALSELLTAAIPIDTLRRHLQRDGSLAVATTASSSNENNTPESTWQPPRFVSQVVALRLPGILRSLADETGHGKGKSGLAAKYGGCGPLAAPALTILTRLCEIQEPPSAAVAAPFLSIIRHVARSLEQDLPDGVLRFLVAAPQPRTHQQQHHHSSEMSANPLPNSDGEMTAAAAGANSNSSVVRWKASPRIQSQIAAHMLTAALTEIGDSVVFSCICSSGGKVRPGLLFLALQRGLPTTGRSSGLSKYPTCIHRLPPQQLQAVRRVVLAVQDMMNRQSASKRLMLEAFSTECIQSLCCMSVGWAPTLIRFEDVLNSTDEYVNNDADTRLQEVVGKEIRRLTFSLLADSSRSPLLQAISGTNKPNQNATSSEQIIVRAMAYLIEEDGNPLEVRRFVLYTLNMAPNLLPALFRVLLLPDMARTPCQLAARLNCISFFLRQGPCAKDCLSVEGPFVAADDTIALVFVPFALKKTYFMKALQSTSALVAFEALKLYGSILARHRDFRMYHVNEKYPSQVTVVTECLVSSLPDLAMLSNALAKLNTTANAKSDVVLYAYICDVIRLYVVEFHRKFDLCKVLSTDAESFLHFPLFVQKMIVSAIQVAISTQEVR